MLVVRSALASALCLVAAACMRSWGGHLPWQLWLPVGFLVAAGGLLHHRHTGSQILARAVLWANLLLGLVVAWLGVSRERPVAAVLALATGGALLLLGRRGLEGDARGGRFVPVAFRSTLTAILVMALADAQTLLLFGSLFAAEHGHQAVTGAVALGLAALLGVSILGLYRLKVWGLLLNFLAAGALIAVNLLGVLDLPPLFRFAFVATAGLQALLALPLFAALATGADAAPAALPRRAVWLGAFAVVGVMAAALVPVVF